MAADPGSERWATDGKFFRSGGKRVWMRAVTYGPFPGGWPASFDADFSRMAGAGFNAIRLYGMPSVPLLDAAERYGLRVFGGLEWNMNADFIGRPGLFSGALVRLEEELRRTADHPALAGVYVGNEIPADLVRWMGAVEVRKKIEELIAAGKARAPRLMFAYANYPSTEYLEPENADFTAFNVYLEEKEDFRKYVKRLHHVAGDRPLVISEFGLDSRRNGLEKQAAVLRWGLEIAKTEESAGLTVYAWSDRWWNAGQEVLDWDFGLTARDGTEKPALAAIRDRPASPETEAAPLFSVIVCTRNGRERIGACLTAVGAMTDGNFETIVVDDGSTDGTADFVAEHFPCARLLRLKPGGLSVARNAGAAAAKGEVLAFTDDDCEPDAEWVARLRRVFAGGTHAAAGGPNLPPPPRSWREAVVCAAPGAPSHVMLDDEEAEHLPGCNLAVTKAAFEAIGGFDPQFHTAGDDVDFCWRLREAGFRLGFAPGAFVWHWRRPSLETFLRQQAGYGKAERLLIAKHPAKFSKRGGAKWEGFVYGGGPVRAMEDSVIYHGPMGQAGYQSVVNRMLPLRGLDPRFDSAKARLALRGVVFLQPVLRAWARSRTLWTGCRGEQRDHRQDPPTAEFPIPGERGLDRTDFIGALLEEGWSAGGETAGWDLEKDGTRLQLATERGEKGKTRTLVRVWGNGGEALLRRLEKTARERP